MILLDTHVLLWMMGNSTRLGSQTKELMTKSMSDRQLYVSAITFWEIGMLLRRRRLTINHSIESLRAHLLKLGGQEVPVNGTIGIRSNNLTRFHKDPADRIIVATALEGYTLLTSDQQILRWPSSLPRHNASE